MTASPTTIIKITPAAAGLPVDKAILAADLLGLSRRKVRRLLDCGGIKLNGTRVRVASAKVKAGDRIEVIHAVAGG